MSLQNVSLYEEKVCLWDRKRNGSTKTGKYSCRRPSMLSRHFRAHYLNISEMRLLFLCDARIQESLSEGVRGGGRPACRKTTATTFFLNPQLILQLYMGGPTFFRGGGGSNISRGGGVQMLISIKTHITCDFPEGVLTPCPPLWIRACLSSHCH